MIRKAHARWRGNGKDGTGQLTTGSRALKDTPYGYKTRFESGVGANPEELIAAAHAGCFAMALAFGLQGAGVSGVELDVDAAVTLEPEGSGFKISKSALALAGRAQGIDAAKFKEFAELAKKNCPVSKVLNAEITLEVKFG
jgi:osmotically inducible protein OsmC